jgi:hypothetical protein
MNKSSKNQGLSLVTKAVRLPARFSSRLSHASGKSMVRATMARKKPRCQALAPPN